MGGFSAEAARKAEALSSQGERVLAVAAGGREPLTLAGFLGFSDPVRDDSCSLVTRLQELGIRVLLVSGDAEPAARAVARRVGIGDRVCSVPIAPATARRIRSIPVTSSRTCIRKRNFGSSIALRKKVMSLG
ncbi:protein of unknown function [Methylacidimicrobium sp. AP8]|uniref:HAD family hydrolase n=1 Tax=Methylacidimicrobium sp. AP8 TaxID=2730359 RepID=UPI0018BFFED5|nr:HAD family hydrolase [Methylacidimicrobium sp. AP8]CAB4242480.1 protein of unknown function [Methylacidimicrobium sp. AP8]